LAALARKVGLLPVIIINKAAPPPVLRGNLLLVALTGADIRYLAAADYEKEMDAHCDNVVAEYAQRGIKLYRVRPDRSQMLGAAAGLRSLLELREQVDAAGLDPVSITLSAASGSQAGMVLACRALEWDVQVRGVAPVIWREPLHARSARFANQLAETMHWPLRLSADDIHNDLAHVGEGYQMPTPASMNAVRLAAETEGIFLDPNYTGKALAALIDDLAQGTIDRKRPVIFWHTGGVPALFSADQEITEYLHAYQSTRG
jgi:1-aminocyclopropane-1-carboxylate deaminase/D-cysteine desulfhydrase-like pyridoxal-dependent ACC family enzyme